jgi:hypothetical protein
VDSGEVEKGMRKINEDGSAAEGGEGTNGGGEADRCVPRRQDELVREAARLQEGGYRVLPLNGKTPWDVSRNSALKEWQEFSPGPDFETYFAAPVTGIGIVLGEASGGVVDVDLDCPEAVAPAPMLLPATDFLFGRESAGCATHYLYRVDGSLPQTKRFIDPDG